MGATRSFLYTETDMAHKDPQQWRGSSWMIPVDRHFEMRKMLEELGLKAPGNLILALVHDRAATVAALKPLVEKYLAANAKAPAAVDQRKQLTAKMKEMSPEQLAKLVALAETVAPASTETLEQD